MLIAGCDQGPEPRIFNIHCKTGKTFMMIVRGNGQVVWDKTMSQARKVCHNEAPVPTPEPDLHIPETLPEN